MVSSVSLRMALIIWSMGVIPVRRKNARKKEKLHVRKARGPSHKFSVRLPNVSSYETSSHLLTVPVPPAMSPR